ncbi:MAG: DUF2828 family protein [Erysipelotrichaceae bacterium]|nr:DUF2828 family protein [Erysipelotrichaceae bacterium]
MGLLDKIKDEQNYTLTENDALAFESTKSALVDLFAIAGAMRERDDSEIIDKFAKAMAEDNLLATRIAFYTRDVRGGLGERRTGRLMLHYLAVNYPAIFRKNLEYIVDYGRWDDLVYLLKDMPDEIVMIIKKQLEQDLKDMADNKPVSLMAKWLPSVNTSNYETVKMGRYLAKELGMSEKQYRKTLSSLRRYINVVEVNLSAKRYEDIIYPEVPSLAMNRYRKAFKRNDEERFDDYLQKVSTGEAKINASVLYPYDIVEKYLYHVNGVDPVLEEQWKALPNYVEGENKFLIMADVSGSMYGRPMATSVGLSIYFASRNKGLFANHFMTFSAEPKLVEIKGNNLYEQIRYIIRAEWGMNTNLEAAFRLLLYTAVKHKVPKEDMPQSIVVITDMEIDACTSPDWTFYDLMKKDFEANGYDMPNIVFWNVNSRNNTYHASFDRKGVQLASGQSTVVFESLVKGLDLTPYDYMLTVINAPRYERITV